MTRCDWAPYLKASFDRNPVCLEGTRDLSDDSLVQILKDIHSNSIYDGPRLAQPDEVWNFQTGDGLEKAILLSTVWKQRHPDDKIELTVQPDRIELIASRQTFLCSRGPRPRRRGQGPRPTRPTRRTLFAGQISSLQSRKGLFCRPSALHPMFSLDLRVPTSGLAIAFGEGGSYCKSAFGILRKKRLQERKILAYVFPMFGKR